MSLRQDPVLFSELERRWQERVVRKDGCWLWKGYKLPHGYGILHYRGKSAYAHRLSYEIHVGPIPDGLNVLHHCDNPSCSNPEHLFLGTQADNYADMRRKGREDHARGSAHGLARITEEQALAIYKDPRPPEYIANEYGIGRTTVRNIKSGRTWSHVTGHMKESA